MKKTEKNSRAIRGGFRATTAQAQQATTVTWWRRFGGTKTQLMGLEIILHKCYWYGGVCGAGHSTNLQIATVLGLEGSK
jgi:hypothetical protein